MVIVRTFLNFHMGYFSSPYKR